MRTIALGCLLANLEGKNYRQVDLLPAELLDETEQTIPGSLESGQLMLSLRTTTAIFFDLAAQLDSELAVDKSSALAGKMRKYLKMKDVL